MDANFKFEITKVQNGFQYTLNGKQYVQPDAENIPKIQMSAITETISDMKPGDKYILEINGIRK